MADNYMLAFQSALADYSDWLSKQKSGPLMVATVNELKGIFYNKLLTRLKETGLNGYELRKNFFTSDFGCDFEHPGYIKKILLVVDPNYGYHSYKRKELLTAMKKTFEECKIKTYSTKTEWELDKIINSIKT